MRNEKMNLNQQLEELKVLAGIYKPYQMEDTTQENISLYRHGEIQISEET